MYFRRRKRIEHMNRLTTTTNKNSTNSVRINRFSDIISSKKFAIKVFVGEKWKGYSLESGMLKTETSI